MKKNSWPIFQEIKNKLNQNFVQQPKLYCQQGHLISNICVNPDCQSALICEQHECISRGNQIHRYCTSLGMRNFTQLVNQPILKFKQFLSQIGLISKKYIDSMNSNLLQLAQQYSSHELHFRQQKVVNDIFDKKILSIAGKDVRELYQAIKKETMKKQAYYSILKEKYDKFMKEHIENIIEKQEDFFQSYQKAADCEMRIIKSQKIIDEQVVKQDKTSMRDTNQRRNGFGLYKINKLLQSYEISQPHDLFCSNKRLITRLCINKNCNKTALICDNSECYSCGYQHLHCQSIILKRITKLLKERVNDHKSFIIELCYIQNRFIQQLCKSRQYFSKKYYLGDLEKKYHLVVDEVYFRKNQNYLKGKQARQFFKRIQRTEMKLDFDERKLQSMYEQEINFFQRKLIAMKQNYYNSFVNRNSVPAIKHHCKIINVHQTLIGPKLYLIGDKNMISQLSNEKKQFLAKSLSYPKQLQLIFRASENQFKASAFYQKCGDLEDTLVIVRTEFGKTIGGFSHYKWDSIQQDEVMDDEKRSFLLQIDLMQKMIHDNNEDRLILCDEQYGPIFGSGADLFIANNCNNNNMSHAKFPTSYNCEGPNKYVRNQDSYRAFSGATEGYKFRVEEYQVFYVLYD